MVSDYATKSIALVDFKAFAIAVPLPRGPEYPFNAKLFSNLENFDRFSEEDRVCIGLQFLGGILRPGKISRALRLRLAANEHHLQGDVVRCTPLPG